ncbi:MAG: helix-turn-helix transcriptional regulator [Hyphomonadaceae bacterium]|nr:helix-turn-helix transcriptional regulator [Hyphomonadaceae bacterium]
MPRAKISAREVLALNLIRLRKDRGWTQEVLADECGLHRTYIGDIERQQRNVSIDNIERLAAALDVETWLLLKR